MGSRDRHCSSEYVRPDARPKRTAPAGVAARMVMQRLSGSSESESLWCHMAEGIYFSTTNGMRYVYSTLEAFTHRV